MLPRLPASSEANPASESVRRYHTPGEGGTLSLSGLECCRHPFQPRTSQSHSQGIVLTPLPTHRVPLACLDKQLLRLVLCAWRPDAGFIAAHCCYQPTICLYLLPSRTTTYSSPYHHWVTMITAA